MVVKKVIDDVVVVESFFIIFITIKVVNDKMINNVEESIQIERRIDKISILERMYLIMTFLILAIILIVFGTWQTRSWF